MIQKYARKQKILQVFYEPFISGITRHIISLLHALKDAPFEFYILCSTRDRKIRDTLKAVLGKGHVRIVPPGRFFSFNGFLEIRRAIRRQKIDIVHIHNLQTAPWAYAAVALSGCRRVFFTPHVVSIAGKENEKLELLSSYAWKLLNPFTMRYIAVSKSQYDWMLHRGIAAPEQVELVSNHIQKSELQNRCNQEPRAVRKKNGIDKTSVMVTQMARLDRQKNPFFLIKVAELIKKEAPEIVFVLIGEGPLKARMVREIKRNHLQDCIRLNGYCHDGLDILRASDIVTLTSRWEGLPYVLLEASYFKKPIVATDIPGIQDLVTHGESGYLTNREEAFADRLVQLAQSKALREQMGEKGYLRNASLFDLGNMTEKMKKIYGSIEN